MLVASRVDREAFLTHSCFDRYTWLVKASHVKGWVAAAVSGLSFQACSGSGVGFSTPGGDGRTQGGARGMSVAGAGGSSQGGESARAGAAAGTARAGTSGDAGAGGDVSDGGDAGASGESNVAGAAHGGSSGGAGAAHAGTSGGGAHAGGAGAGGAGSGGIGGGGSSGMGGTPILVCGNSLLEGNEQCDDGNTARLDGCNGNCGFEVSQRANWFKVQFEPDNLCPANGFGAAFPALTRAVLQPMIDARVADGSFSLLFAFLDLADPNAPNGSSFSLGVLNGTPAVGAGYDGKSDLDWWYAPAAGAVDANKNPVSKLSAQIAGGVLTASGLKLQLPLFSAVPLGVSSALLRLSIGASSTPLSSTGAPPGHLAAEHLSASLTSFASASAPNDAGAGELCGNISAASLKAEQIPAAYLSTGATPCAQGYTSGNTFLDFLVGGCTIAVGSVSVLALIATQPDQVDASTVNPGAGGPYKLSASGTSGPRVINTCLDKSGTPVSSLANCLAAAAYSSAFKLATGRVIIK